MIQSKYRVKENSKARPSAGSFVTLASELRGGVVGDLRQGMRRVFKRKLGWEGSWSWSLPDR